MRITARKLYEQRKEVFDAMVRFVASHEQVDLGNPAARRQAEDTVKKLIEAAPTVMAADRVMDSPIPPSGKRLGDCTREDLRQSISLRRLLVEYYELDMQILEMGDATDRHR
jgi:hypothetical protein